MLAGRLEIVRPSGASETLVVILDAGAVLRRGQHAFRAGRRWSVPGLTEAGEVMELDRAELLALVQTDSALGEIFMRAFILRRRGV